MFLINTEPLQLRCYSWDKNRSRVRSQGYAVLVGVDFKGKSTTSSATGTRMSSSGGKKCGPKQGPF